jgi:hypothetical protein
MKSYVILFVASAVFVAVGCSPSAVSSSSSGDSANDTSRLDSMGERDPKTADFVRRVEGYYQALQKQDWPATYEMRVAEFKQDVMRDYYLKTIAEDGKRWRLDNYKVLNVAMYSGPNGGNDAAEMIIRFDEGGMVSYASARWKKRGGIWLCDEPGLGEALLHSTRIPDWITN